MPQAASRNSTGAPAKIAETQTIVNPAPFVQSEMDSDHDQMHQSVNYVSKALTGRITESRGFESPNDGTRDCSVAACGHSDWIAGFFKSDLWNLGSVHCSRIMSAHTTHTAYFLDYFGNHFEESSAASDATPQQTSSCSPPRAAMMMTYQSLQGANLDIAIPTGLSASVSLSSSPTTLYDDGPAAYSWSAGGSQFATGATTTYSTSSSAMVVLGVIAEDGQTNSASGGITLEPLICPDGSEPLIGDCPDVPEGGSVGGSGATMDDGTAHGGVPGSVWYCDVTIWYEWINGAWRYVGYDNNGCYLDFP